MLLLVIWLVIAIALVTLSLVWLVTRRERYRTPGPRQGYVATSEVVVDPETGRRQRVYEDPTSGRRSYVDEPLPPPVR